MEGLDKFVRQDELNLIIYHHGTGRMIRNQWGLWDHSPIAQYFESRGVEHPDEMSHIILTAFHRQQNGKAKDLDQLIADSVEQTRAFSQPASQ